MLSASRDDSITGYLNKSYLKGRKTRSETKAICKKQQSTHIKQEVGIGYFVVCKVTLILSVLKQNYKVALSFLSSSWLNSNLVLCWCSVRSFIPNMRPTCPSGQHQASFFFFLFFFFFYYLLFYWRSNWLHLTIYKSGSTPSSKQSGAPRSCTKWKAFKGRDGVDKEVQLSDQASF